MDARVHRFSGGLWRDGRRRLEIAAAVAVEVGDGSRWRSGEVGARTWWPTPTRCRRWQERQLRSFRGGTNGGGRSSGWSSSPAKYGAVRTRERGRGGEKERGSCGALGVLIYRGEGEERGVLPAWARRGASGCTGHGAERAE